MKTTIIVYTLTLILIALVTPAKPQTMFDDMPTTAKVVGPDGEQIGTATKWGGSTTFRRNDGKLMGTLTMDAPGQLTLRDPDGKITEQATTEGNTVTVRDADGKVIRTTTKENDGTYTVK